MMFKKILILVLFSGCLMGCFRPYVVDVQQGNIVDQAKLNSLTMGMTKQEVRNLLGTPVLVDVFDQDCWTYAYTKQIHGGKIATKVVNLYFVEDHLTNIQNNPPHKN